MVTQLLWLLACSGSGGPPTSSDGDGATDPGAQETAVPEPLPVPELMARISLDVRGIRPTEEEILAVEADPATLDPLINEWLQDPRFMDRVVSTHADIFLTRADGYVVGADGDAEFLDDAGKALFIHAVGEEPLRLMAKVAYDDRPWTDIVTADWTMVDDHLLAHFPVEALEEGEGWRMGRYTDSRPAAGVITTNGLWWRYTTTVENVNRGRAEAIARHLLCDDRFDQPVEFQSTSDSFDPGELEERVSSDPTCVGCHVVLDPLGSYLYGFYRHHPESYTEALRYYPGRENLWEQTTGVPPGFYGEPGDNLYDLGDQIAGDPRFVGCAVEHAFAFLMNRKPDLTDTDALTGHREAFIQGGLLYRDLYRSILTDPGYRSADEEVAGTVAMRRVTPDMLSAEVEALTGFRWTWQDVDMMVNDTFGVRVLAGGADGIIVSIPATDHAATSQLVQERLGEAAASYLVEVERALPAEGRTLLKEVDLEVAPTDEELAVQIVALRLRMHSRHVDLDDPELADLVQLWHDLDQEGQEPSWTWAMFLSAMLRHPDFIHY